MDEQAQNQVTAGGFEEIDHTADWSIRAWAPDFAALLGQITGAIHQLAGVELGVAHSDERETFDVDGADREDLLVAWLSELVFRWSARRESLVDLDFEHAGGQVEVSGRRAPIVAQEKDVKAVTYHGLDVRETERGIEACVTFDV